MKHTHSSKPHHGKANQPKLYSGKLLDYVALFVLDAASMILELVASRFLSPYFGNTNYVWTAIIGIILLAGSLGNLIGGRISKFTNARLIITWILFATGLYLAVTPIIGIPILQNIKEWGLDVQFLATVASLIFFLIPATAFGVIIPVVMKERIGEAKDQGQESGRITAISAIGSLAGTFVGGFWLIPALGTKMIFAMLAFIVLLSIPLIAQPQRLNKLDCLVKLAFPLIIALLLTGLLTILIDDANPEGLEKSIDTEYGRIIIQDDGKIRHYIESAASESATYLDPDRKYDLVYSYPSKYDEMFHFIDAKDVLMIGGAAYQYPKYYIANFPDKRMDVVEIDPVSTEIAKEYFFLDDLIADYNLESTGRLGLYNDDGRIFIANSDKRYDAILNDAFSGEIPPGNLSTIEAAQIIRSHLNKNGVYMSNVLGALEGDKGKFLRAEYKTLSKVFKYVYVLPVYKNVAPDQYTNWILVATDNNEYKPQNTAKATLTREDIVLTDDYCPIDTLVGKAYLNRD